MLVKVFCVLLICFLKSHLFRELWMSCGNAMLFYDMFKCLKKFQFVSNCVCFMKQFKYVMQVCTSLLSYLMVGGDIFLTVSTMQEGSCQHQPSKLSHQHVLVYQGVECLISGAEVPVAAFEDHIPQASQSTTYYFTILL